MEGNAEDDFRLDDYDYHLPSERIAQTPSHKREASRLLVLDRRLGQFEHRRFEDILAYFMPGDVLVVNNTRVVRARLTGHKGTGGRVELLVLDPYKDPALGMKDGYNCLIKASKPPRRDQTLIFEKNITARILDILGEGQAKISFQGSGTLLELLDEIGSVPLPPYIKRDSECSATLRDSASYQTVYACKPGAVAAPTAGLHFSKELLEMIVRHGVEVVNVTLHVGHGTFAPIRVEDIREHRMHSEYAEVSPQAAAQIERARAEGRRVVAVGTTSVRIMEWLMTESGKIEPFSGFCNHYIYPGYAFSIVNAMITNFHLPKSTLMLLVSAFAGRKPILDAYAEAVREGYRFFSYGDAMLIL